jgi:xanthine dehydrogenase accessory factor
MNLGERTRLYEALKTALDAGLPCGQATIVKGPGIGNKIVLLPDRTLGSAGTAGLDAVIRRELERALDDERSLTKIEIEPASGDEVEVFYEVFPAPPTLLIFGAVHVAQALTRMAKMLGFRVIVSDARAKLATRERFPAADQIIQAWPDDTLSQLSLPPSTYVAILTHDPKFDEPALLGTLDTHARYIGAVGSRKTNADRRQRLIDAGVGEASLSRIRGPIGLDIGADTPEEMAISILAEIIAVRHGREGGPLTHVSGNIRGERGAAEAAASGQ